MIDLDEDGPHGAGFSALDLQGKGAEGIEPRGHIVQDQALQADHPEAGEGLVAGQGRIVVGIHAGGVEAHQDHPLSRQPFDEFRSQPIEGFGEAFGIGVAVRPKEDAGRSDRIRQVLGKDPDPGWPMHPNHLARPQKDLQGQTIHRRAPSLYVARSIHMGPRMEAGLQRRECHGIPGFEARSRLPFDGDIPGPGGQAGRKHGGQVVKAAHAHEDDACPPRKHR